MVQEQVVIDDDDDDEIEPLFSYKRVCRPPSDADSDEDVIVVDSKKALQSYKKRGVGHFPILLKPTYASSKEIDNITKEVEDDDDWLPPPPKSAKVLVERKINEDPTVRELRQEREELRQLAATTEARLRHLEEEMKAQKSASQLHETIDVSDGPVPAAGKREKVLIAIQNKDGMLKNFKVFKDEKFEKLFTKYAESIGVAVQQLVFSFDGEKVLDDNTPKDMDIEDEDIIEVNVRN